MASLSPPTTPGMPSRERTLLGVATAVVVAFYLWALVSSMPSLTSAKSPGYYGLLTDALTSGQLHLKIEPDPALAKLANPWGGAQGIPRVHDAVYFNGHYYLYFGVTPVLILLAPWHLLFGNYLNEGTATVIFALVGFLLSTRLWVRIKNAWFPTLPSGWTALGVLMIGLGNYIYFLLSTSVFYHVPIVCAYMCLTIALTALEEALRTTNSANRIFFLMLTSLSWGLCVGARPNYVFSLPLLGFAAWSLVLRRSREENDAPLKIFPVVLALLVPAALVGAGLASYNYARFGNPAEFGVRYQFASIDQRFLKLTDPANLKTTLKSYLFDGAIYTPYFPFIEEKTDVVGTVVWAPFALLALFFPVVAVRACRRNGDGLGLFTSIVFASGFLHLFSLGLIPFANDRYVADFLPEATFCALLVVAEWVVSTSPWRFVSALGKALVLVAAADTLVHADLLAFQRAADPQDRRRLAQWGDSIAPLWERLFGIENGRIELALRFGELSPGRRDPIVSTDQGRDLLFVEYKDDQHLRFGFFHAGAGGPTGDLITIEPGKLYHLGVDLGSLYPPEEHPAFRGWDDATIDALHRRVEVYFEGRKVLQWTSGFYDPNPFVVQIGRNTKTNITARKFSGTIESVRRLGLPTPDQVPSVPGDGAVQLTVKFPPFTNIISQPILSTGRPGAGDLVYVTYLSPTRLRFGHDSWGAGAIETLEVDYDPQRTHTIDLDMGSLHAAARGLEEGKHALKIRFDDLALISTYRPFHRSSPLDVSLGYDTTQSTAASPFFTGPTLSAERIARFPEPPPAQTGWGPVRILLQQPTPLRGTREPVLVSGSPGAGDFVYLVFDDESHLRIGLDHWGTNGFLSDPIEINPRNLFAITISTAALYPPAMAKEWINVPNERQKRLQSSFLVAINGHLVIDVPLTAYPAEPAEIYIGTNPLGGSSCSLRFSGVIQSVERLKVGTNL